MNSDPTPKSRPPLTLDLGDRPILGRDLLLLQQWLGLDLTELTAALGISPARWRELTTERPDDPVDDPALALLVWSILTFPAQSYLPVYPEVEAVYATFQELAPGAPRGNARQKTRRLMLVFDAVLRAHGAAGLRRWLERVELEAAQRGIDLWEGNSWREKSAPPPDDTPASPAPPTKPGRARSRRKT
ncbi:MAG: hypothetical protein RKP73_16185 [Candidatus Contendobacter sp.]|nr:hypothetical protein [Candidatus Contendobacter sp.]